MTNFELFTVGWLIGVFCGMGIMIFISNEMNKHHRGK